MKTSLEVITEQLEDVGKICDGWRKRATDPDGVCPFSNSPTWAFTARHTRSGGVRCEPVTYLLCDTCHDLAWNVLMPFIGKVLKCECGEGGLRVPDSYILKDERL